MAVPILWVMSMVVLLGLNSFMASRTFLSVTASSADVEKMVAGPAEQVLSQIHGIEHTYSVSRPGAAVTWRKTPLFGPPL